jgi:curved DNA-binding protein
VPAGTQNGTKVKLKGKDSVYKKGRSIWDLYITYEIKNLISLSEKKKELFTELSTLRAL